MFYHLSFSLRLVFFAAISKFPHRGIIIVVLFYSILYKTGLLSFFSRVHFVNRRTKVAQLSSITADNWLLSPPLSHKQMLNCADIMRRPWHAQSRIIRAMMRWFCRSHNTGAPSVSFGCVSALRCVCCRSSALRERGLIIVFKSLLMGSITQTGDYF